MNLDSVFRPFAVLPGVLIKADHWLVKPPNSPYYTFIYITVPLFPSLCVDDSLEIRGNNPLVLAGPTDPSVFKMLIYALNRSFHLGSCVNHGELL